MFGFLGFSLSVFKKNGKIVRDDPAAALCGLGQLRPVICVICWGRVQKKGRRLVAAVLGSPLCLLDQLRFEFVNLQGDFFLEHGDEIKD